MTLEELQQFFKEWLEDRKELGMKQNLEVSEVATVLEITIQSARYMLQNCSNLREQQPDIFVLA